MGLSAEQVDAVIEEHTSSIDALKEQRDDFKEKAKKADDVQKELDDLKTSIADGDDWKSKYDEEHKAFDDYKKDVTKRENEAKVKSAYKQLLIDNKVADKHLDAVLRITDYSNMKLDENGKLVDADKLAETIKNDWSDFITEKSTVGASVSTPPAGVAGTMTKADILKIKNVGERQKAIAENRQLFGLN